MNIPWWKTATFYQIYPRSFCDASGDGVGDLQGIRKQFDHILDLGVDALWFSPLYPSPMADFGYDVAEYCDVDPVYGNLETLDALLTKAHDSGIRVILDWVPNHTSDEHPWFVDAKSSRDARHRDWYIWRDPATGGKPPNNWIQAFNTDPAWTFDPDTGQSFLHLFLPGQPDLNWSNPEVREAMYGVLDFWLDRGFDGFRADVINAIGKDPSLRDTEHPEIPRCVSNHDPLTHDYLRDIRQQLDARPNQPMMVGETVGFDTRQIASYYGHGDELHLAFNFNTLYSPWEASVWRQLIGDVEREMEARDAWPTWALSNHDRARHRTRFGSETKARAAAVLLLTLRGTPFLYAGEELGLEDAVITAADRLDPGDRDGCRAPIPWDAAPLHGWAAKPWLPFPPDASTDNAESQRSDPDSMLSLYKNLIALRKESAALKMGSLELIHRDDKTVCFRRQDREDSLIVAVNFTDDAVDTGLSGEILLSSVLGHVPGTFTGSLGGDEAIVLRPGN